MGQEISIGELAARTGEPLERLREWRSLGLIGSPDTGGFAPEDVERARLVQLLLRRGIGLETVGRAQSERSGFLDRYLNAIFPQGVAAYSLAEAAEIIGVVPDLLREFWNASGLAEQGESLDEEDLKAFRMLKVALDAGFPRDALMQLVRVYADALGRVADAEFRITHYYLHHDLVKSGLSGPALFEADLAMAERLNPLIEPAILYFHRKAFSRVTREDLVVHLAEQEGLLGTPEVPGQLRAAIAFADLSSFTPLTEAMGDVEAAGVLERFSNIVRQAAGRWDGRVVKQIGDAFMLVFPDARSAVACALEIEERAAAEPQFPAARSGVHWGPVLYREGDYVGSNVNIAARLAGEAERHQVLVSAAVRKEAKGLAEVEFVRLGKRRLKGLAEEIDLFEARTGARQRERLIDPVCGMELGAEEVAARLSLEGEERVFCSEECLRRFVAAPEKYGG